MRKNISQLKRQRQDEKRRVRNRGLRSEMRTTLRKAREAVADKPAAEDTRALLAKANRAIDIMVSKGVVHKNTAGRYKSRLVRSHRQKLGPQKQEPPAPEKPETGKTDV